MSIDYRDIRIHVDTDSCVLRVEYLGGGGLRLPFKKLEINYPAGQLLFKKEGLCRDKLRDV